MRIKFIFPVFNLLVIFLLALSSCRTKDSQIVAKKNAEIYIENKLTKIFHDDFKILEFKHSDLYILEPLDKSKVEKPKCYDLQDEVKDAENALSMFDSFVGLSMSGCNRGNLETIIKNDKHYQEWETGAEEYVLITFVNIQDNSGRHSEEIGMCFKLSKDLNILDTYSIKDEDYVYIRLFGQTPERFYGAVDCEYSYLSRMYDMYVKNIKEDNYNTIYKYVFIKELNKLFDTEYFELMDSKELTVENCLKKLDELKDKMTLKDIAYNIIKSF